MPEISAKGLKIYTKGTQRRMYTSGIHNLTVHPVLHQKVQASRSLFQLPPCSWASRTTSDQHRLCRHVCRCFRCVLPSLRSSQDVRGTTKKKDSLKPQNEPSRDGVTCTTAHRRARPPITITCCLARIARTHRLLLAPMALRHCMDPAQQNLLKGMIKT